MEIISSLEYKGIVSESWSARVFKMNVLRGKKKLETEEKKMGSTSKRLKNFIMLL